MRPPVPHTPVTWADSAACTGIGGGTANMVEVGTMEKTGRRLKFSHKFIDLNKARGKFLGATLALFTAG